MPRTKRSSWQNESQTDRLIRLVVAAAAAAGALHYHGTVSLVLWIIAAVAAVSGLSGFALPYKLLGISTLKKRR